MTNRELHVERLRTGLAAIDRFRTRDARQRDPEFDMWQQDMVQSLAVVLPDASYATRLRIVQFRDGGGAYTGYIPDHQKHRIAGLRQAELLIQSALEEAAHQETIAAPISPFVDPVRIAALKAAQSTDFDLQRLVRMCEELNACYASECYLAVAMLTRAIVDHVPPLFSKSTFAEVASNYAAGRSFKGSMQHLERSARNIADSHLHQHIRARETLPTQTQVNFQPDLDVLLAEIIRVS